MTKEQMNELNTYFDGLDHNIQVALNKSYATKDKKEELIQSNLLIQLLGIRSKIAEITME